MPNSNDKNSYSDTNSSFQDRFAATMNRILSRFEPDRTDEIVSEEYVLRQRVLAVILLSGTVLGTATLLLVLPILLIRGQYLFMALDMVIVLFWSAILFWKDLKYELRTKVALLALFIFGLAISYNFGVISSGPLWLFCFAVLTALLLDYKAALVAVLLNLLSLVFLGWLNPPGGLVLPMNHQGSCFNMGLDLAAFGILNIATVLVVGALVKWLRAIHQREEDALALLRDERCEIVETNLQLMDEVQERKRIEDDLRNSEERFRQLVDLLPEAVYELDVNGRILFLNQAGFRIFDYNHDEIAEGVNIFDQLLPHEISRARGNFQSRLEGALKGGTEYTVRHKNGFPMEVRIYNSPVFREGVLCGFRGILIDVTDQKRAKEALRFSEEKFSKAFQKSPVWVNLTSLDDGRYLEVNRAFLESTGYKRDEVIGKTSLELGVWNDPRERLEVVRRVKAGASVRNLEVERRTQRGKKLSMLLSADVVSIGGEDYMLCVSLDVTERIRAQQELLKSEKRYRRLFDNITDWIYTQDLKGRILSANQAVSTTLGYSLEELVGHKPSEFMVVQDQELSEPEYISGMKRNQIMEGNAVFLTKGGEQVHIEYRSVMVRPNEEAPYISGMGREVTSRIKAQRELRSLEDQLVQSQKMGAVGTLAAGMAHEFNNTLQAVSGFTQTMLLDPGDEAANRKYLSQIGDVVDDAAELVRRMLSFSRKSEEKMVQVDLNLRVTETVPIIEKIIPGMINMKTSLQPGLGFIMADPIQLEQILVNLAINAKDAMPDGGRLTIKTRYLKVETEEEQKKYSLTPGKYARLIIADTGVGIEEEIRESIFEPFFTTKKSGQGTGLGLSTVSDIVDKHNGRIICKSSVGEWTCFEIFLPLVDGEKVVQRDYPKAKEEVRGANRDSGTILMVDDEPAILTSAREYLTKSGYRVITALNGEAALDIFKRDSEKIDLVVLDLNMPGMGGRMTLKELLRLESRLKVVVASGFFNQEERQTALDYGAVDFIAKPYKMTNLTQTLRQALNDPPPDYPGA